MSEKENGIFYPKKKFHTTGTTFKADMVNKPMPPLHPGTKQPLKAEDLYPIFAKELCHQGTESNRCMDRNTGRSTRNV